MFFLAPKKIKILILTTVFSLCVSTSTVFAENAIGSIYSLEGSLVSESGNLTGAQYSLSGSGESTVGQSGGSQYSQNSGVYSVSSGSGSSAAASSGNSVTYGGTEYYVGSVKSVMTVQAYSYYDKELTVVVYLSNPQDVASIFLVNQKETISQTALTALNNNVFLIKFTGVNVGDYNLILNKPTNIVSSPIKLYSLKINAEGNGVANGFDSSVNSSIKNENVASGTKKIIGKKSVEISPAKPIVPDTSKIVPCTIYGLGCKTFSIIYLFIFGLLYIIYKYTLTRFKR